MFGFSKCKGKGGKKKKLSDILSFPIFFFDTEEGSSGTDGGVIVDDAHNGAETSPGDSDDFPAGAIESDPELKEFLEAEKKAPKKGAEDKGPEDQGADGDNSGADNPEDKDDKKGEDDAKTGDDNSTEENIDDIEFADDVIKGLKGSELKKLPKEALEAIAAYVEEQTGISTEAATTKESLAKLLADPIVKKRMDLLKNGKQEYEVRGINETERLSIIRKLQEKAGLDSEEAETVFSVLKDGLDVAYKDAAKDALQNLILEDEGRRQQEEVIKKGRNVFLGLGKFNKDFQFKETDPDKFWKVDANGKWTVNDSHPEIKKFKEKVLPVMEALGNSGIKYDAIVKMRETFGDEAVYALAARKLGLPVAFNTEARDQKMLASALRKRLGPLIKNGSGELSPKGGSNLSQTKTSAVIKSGYDIERLASDTKYYERALTAKPGDPAHMSLIESLADEGEALLDKKQKPKK